MTGSDPELVEGLGPGTGRNGAPLVGALPPGSRLLHIGLPKTGTTVVQRGAALNRDTLAAHGVCYPGSGFNHRDQTAALMQRPLGWRGRGAKLHARPVWDALMREAVSKASWRDGRTFISHEFVCESTDEQARRFVDELDPEHLHVAITLRGYADLLPSNWQQFVKSGHTGHFEDWLADALDGRTRRPTIRTFVRRNDQTAILRRWIRLLGADRVSVVIADKGRPTQLTDAFEDLLGLPRAATAARPAGGYVANRSLSAAEVELVRRINLIIAERGYDWRRYTSLIRHGVIARMQECRQPGPDEAPLLLPEWAADRALQIAGRHAEAIAASGCRVVGDLSALTAPVRTVTSAAAPTELPVDAAREAVAGLISATEGRGPFFDQAADGVEGRRISDPRLERFVGADGARQVLNAYRATRHLDGSTMAGVLAHRVTDAAGRLRQRLSGRASPASRP
ncbi:hypothetical protein [Microlunatus soli]|uniref:Sulfotransferase family protein n=1 Tax=Microlunatus soli TaxID=630515 RepID=A0A1H1PV63_9ACTN|nr:hypothetical protein [Microlunatus soli]SDS15090.1 hypothetical protein SAMN04489812_1036 [Microlunatus soli]